MNYYIGVDVGSGSCRACLIDDSGTILSLKEKPITKEELITDYITQSSQEIWAAVCDVVNQLFESVEVDRKQVLGIGFDATCSLVVLDQNSGEPIGVGPNFNDNDRNIIMWMDHRALKETNVINQTNHKSLKYVGGKVSVEMELPKLCWLKNNLAAETFKRCQFLDLANFLTFKSTGDPIHSYSAAVCKQAMLPLGVEGSTTGWSKPFLDSINLGELAEDNFAKLGGVLTPNSFLSAGECIRNLSDVAAAQLGLTTKCVVGSGIIDAYAGWVGTVAANTNMESGLQRNQNSFENALGRLALVAGTSTCHIVMSKDPLMVSGVWGPYRDVVARNYWCAEGGQSSTGELLAHIISTHPASEELNTKSAIANESKFKYLNTRLENMKQEKNASSILELAKHYFFYGDLRGNRSPIADPTMRSSVVGQSMDVSLDNLAIRYLAACEFIAQQTRQIIEALQNAGHKITAMYMSGGQCKNTLLVSLLSNCTGLPLVIPKYIDSAVVHGSAILGAVAVKLHTKNITRPNPEVHAQTLWDTMTQMTPAATVINPEPADSKDRTLLQTKYQILMEMAKNQQKYRAMVDALDD